MRGEQTLFWFQVFFHLYMSHTYVRDSEQEDRVNSECRKSRSIEA